MVLILNTACRKEKSDPKAALYGDWTWSTSIGGIAGFTYTPQSTGKNVVLRLSPSKNFSVWTNGVLTEEGTFRLYTRQYGSDPTNWPEIEFSSDPMSPVRLHNVNADSLVLVDAYADGYVHYFTR